MKPKKPLNRFWNRNPLFYKIRNWLLFRTADVEELLNINYNVYNPVESIPKIYQDTNALIFQDEPKDLNDFDKALKIARWLRDNIKGGKGLGVSSDKALEYMLAGGFGVCSDFCQIFNNFCVINHIKVREWGLKKIGSDIDGHALNEFYAEELDQWIALDVSKSIYFKNGANAIPLSTLELFSNTNKNLKVVSFNNNYRHSDKMVSKFYLSNQYQAFVIDKYVNRRYDKYLSQYNNLPIPIIHGFLIFLNKSYVYKKIKEN